MHFRSNVEICCTKKIKGELIYFVKPHCKIKLFISNLKQPKVMVVSSISWKGGYTLQLR